MQECSELAEPTILDDLIKIEAERMLTSPLTALSSLFMAEFVNHDPILSQVEYLEGRFVLTFMRRHIPTSDLLREKIFRLYERHWGGKPDGIDCVYKAMEGFGASTPWASQAGTVPVVLFVTATPVGLRNARIRSAHDLPPLEWRSDDKIVTKKTGNRTFVMCLENGLSGEPIPTVHYGLYKV